MDVRSYGVRLLARLAIACLLVASSPARGASGDGPAHAGTSPGASAAEASLAPSAPSARATVVVDGRPLFEVGASGPFNAEERARLVGRMLEDSLDRGAGALASSSHESMPTIRIDDQHLLSVTDADVPPGRTREEQMVQWWRAIEDALARGHAERQPAARARAAGLAAAALVCALLAHLVLQRLARRIPVWIARRRSRGPAQGRTAEDARRWARVLELCLLAPRIGAWLLALAIVVDLFPALRSARLTLAGALSRSLTAPLFQLGGKPYTAEDLLVLPLLLAGLWLGVRAATNGLGAHVLERAGTERGLQERVLAIVRWALLFVGGLVLLQLWGVDVSSIAIAASVLGVGIGFGLQHIANNVVSGLLVTLERPIQPGDFVRVGELMGTVERVGGRSTEVRTIDNVSILVPNSRFLEAEVVNWTRGDPTCRVHVPVGVAYGSDVARVRTALLEAARGHASVLADPPAQVQLRRFAESSLDFELLVWTREPEKQFTLQSDLLYRIEASLRQHGIAIPFPQRDLHLRSPALDALVAGAAERHDGAERPAAPAAAHAGPRPSANGAALQGAFDATRARESWSAAELASVVARMREPGAVDRIDRRHRLKVYPRCFVGREAVDWLVREEGLTRAEAKAVGELLVEAGLARHVLDEHGFEDGNLFYRFRADETA